MTNHTDIAQQLHDAQRQREALAASLPELMQQAEHAVTHRQTVSEKLERHEGDALIGRVNDAKLARTRSQHEAAVLEERKATAMLRQAQTEIARLDEALARLVPEVRAARMAHYRERQAELATQLRAGLDALRPLNDALHDLYIEANTEFPHTPTRGGSTPYPPAAGLTDLSMHELRINPFAANGGRLGTVLKAIDEFLNPPPPVPARSRRAAQPPAAESRDAADHWYRLPQQEAR